jgi:hypothetical protein
VTGQHIGRIEAELGVSLPADYRDLLLNVPFPSPPGDRVYWLYDDPDRVIEATRFPLYGYHEGPDLGPRYLSIGQTAMGDQYVLDLARTPSPVLCLSHETHEFEEDYPDLAAFVAGWHREVALAGEQAAVRERARRWWKFW